MKARGFLVEWRTKVWVTLAILAYYVAGYFSLNRMDFDRYYEVPRTFLDGAPFLPWTFPVYYSVFILAALAIWMHQTREKLKIYLVAALIAYTVNYTLFALLPTEIDRPPLPEEGSIWMWLAEFTRVADEPHTAFPSLHMTNCFLAVFAYRGTGKSRWLLLWTLAMAATTLTTKQHHFWDLPAGAIMAVVGTWGAEWVWRRWGRGNRSKGRRG